MAKSYEVLMGAAGRSVFFRPERQRVRELLSRDARPQLLVDGVHFPLFDISMNGVSFLADADSEMRKVGEEIGLTLVLHDEVVYQGRARVARAETEFGQSIRIGLGLTTGFLDLPEFRRRDDQKQLEKDLLEGPEVRFRLVPERYKVEMAKITHFLKFYKKSLDYHESRYRLDRPGDSGVTALAEQTLEAIRDRWWEMQVSASRAALEVLENRDVLRATKEFTETVVTPLVLESPLGRRAYTKPYGYPGDFQTMLYYYDNQFEGDTAFGKLIHKFFVNDYPLGAGVRSRMDLIVHLMEAEHARTQSRDSNVFRVVNLACGPAREISQFIERIGRWSGGISWTLIDQEEEALSIAYQESRSKLAVLESRGRLSLLNLSFGQMLSDGLPLRESGPQDFIFSTGLFDYVSAVKAKSLVSHLFDLLAPGGLLAVGNAVAPNDVFWATEFLVDWTLLFRTRTEMADLATLLPENAEVSVVAEPLGAYHFLLIRKH